MAISLTLPTTQNWSCHNCSDCCRHHAIEISPEERQRILSQRWSAADGTPTGEALFEGQLGPPGNRRHLIAHQPDGACVFLNERGLCRIHAKFGEAAKPRTCRVFPFAFHPAGKKVALSLRFSCPSVVANQGLPLGQQRDEIQRLAREVAPSDHESLPAPALSARQRVEWPVFSHFIAALDETLAPSPLPIALKLQRALFWLNLVEARFDPSSADRVPEFLEFIRQAASHQFPDENQNPPSPPGEAPSSTAKMMFRMLTAQYARRDTLADLSAGWRVRWKLLRAAMRFTRGRGRIPPLQAVFREVPFAALEAPFGFPIECEELWTRYFRVKIQGLHFCGPAFYGLPLIEGFQGLALIFPATMWIARWLAASQDRQALTLDDVARALAISDRHHGYSPSFATAGFRSRVRVLSQLGEIPKLIRWYTR